MTSSDKILSVRLGRFEIPNPVLVASGTFGYAREMEGLVDLSRLGGIIPKTITRDPRPGNAPWRTVETTGGMLNSIGLDNDGIDLFLEHHLPYFQRLKTPLIVSVAGKSIDDFNYLASRLNEHRDSIAALELNISCPNVSGGVDFGTDPSACEKVVAGVRQACELPLLAKLTPNVADIAAVAQGAEAGGADAVSVINTCLGMAVNWRTRRPLLGNILGGLSGPAIKPIALRAVYQVFRAVKIPVVGVGGIATIDDAMEFFVTGASAIQVGTANFYRPKASEEILDALPGTLDSLGAKSLAEIVGTLDTSRPSAAAAHP